MTIQIEQIARQDIQIAGVPVTLIYGSRTGFDEFWSFGPPRMNAEMHRELADYRAAFIAEAQQIAALQEAGQ